MTDSRNIGAPAAEPAAAPAEPISFVTETGATITIMLEAQRTPSDRAEALVRAKDAVRCLADAFGRAERRATFSDGAMDSAAVFRSWAYQQ
jgi:hypothetical protein